MLTVGDIAEILNVTDQAVYKLLREGKIPFAFKKGRVWQFESRDVRKWMHERKKSGLPTGRI